jgi:FkbM family methyltransferase
MIVQHEQTGLWYRTGTSDEPTFGYVRRDYVDLEIGNGDRVLDLGANIGVFAHRALELGAEHVTCVEPEPRNLELLRRNTEGRPVSVIAAAVGAETGEGTLYVSDTAARDNHSLVTRGRKRAVPVQVVGFADLLRDWQPTVVKCDIEHGEYLLPWTALAQAGQVRGLSVEFHLKHRDADAEVRRIAGELEAGGFRCVRQPRLGTKAWDTIGAWRR